MDIEAVNILGSFDYTNIEIPNDAETYMNLGSMQRFLISLKLAMHEYAGGPSFCDTLKTLEKPLTKTTYVLTDISGNTIGEYDSEDELKNINNINANEFKYLKYYVSDKVIKNPKHDIYYKYRVKTNTYRLNGNTYLLV